MFVLFLGVVDLGFVGVGVGEIVVFLELSVKVGVENLEELWVDIGEEVFLWLFEIEGVEFGRVGCVECGVFDVGVLLWVLGGGRILVKSRGYDVVVILWVGIVVVVVFYNVDFVRCRLGFIGVFDGYYLDGGLELVIFGKFGSNFDMVIFDGGIWFGIDMVWFYRGYNVWVVVVGVGDSNVVFEFGGCVSIVIDEVDGVVL